MAERPADIVLPSGWSWETVERQRSIWSISDDMVPIASVTGVCVAWGTINSVRLYAAGRTAAGNDISGI
jgi:hypothetical protein